MACCSRPPIIRVVHAAATSSSRPTGGWGWPTARSAKAPADADRDAQPGCGDRHGPAAIASSSRSGEVYQGRPNRGSSASARSRDAGGRSCACRSTTETGITIAGGPMSDPALGPVAFMHRPSAAENPAAPLAHHTLDSTHIAMGVVTAALDHGPFTIESALQRPRAGRQPLGRDGPGRARLVVGRASGTSRHRRGQFQVWVRLPETTGGGGAWRHQTDDRIRVVVRSASG